jgi:hypothetical protein
MSNRALEVQAVAVHAVLKLVQVAGACLRPSLGGLVPALLQV